VTNDRSTLYICILVIHINMHELICALVFVAIINFYLCTILSVADVSYDKEYRQTSDFVRYEYIKPKFY
jgi:hypothetical protein